MNEEFEERRTQFNKAKDEYEYLRDKERKELSEYMSDKGLNVVKGSRAGRGGSYSSRGRLVPPYNLANWKWVEIETDNETVIFSLNPYDIDPGSGNIHVLYDRIGIYITSKEKSLLYSTKTIITEYELPLSQKDLEKLYNLIRHNITTYSSSDILNRAIVFATEAHRGAFRKGTGIPYILHPLEAAAIAATITVNYEVLAAAVLHDVIEDTAVTEEEVREVFGTRVAELVCAESENKRAELPAGDTWRIRKQETLDALALEDRRDVKILVLADKLSNVRAIYRDFRAMGDALWERFNMKDKEQIGWYYRSIAGALESELGETPAWQEYRELVEGTFG